MLPTTPSFVVTGVSIPALVFAMWLSEASAPSEELPHSGSREGSKNPPPKLDESTFDKLFELCKPCTEKEAWTEVAWIGEFWTGRQQAARLGKPMFIFAMNGHPLGCV